MSQTCEKAPPGKHGGGGGTRKSSVDEGCQAGTLSTADGARRLDDHESVDGIGGAAGIDGGWLRKRQCATGCTKKKMDDWRALLLLRCPHRTHHVDHTLLETSTSHSVEIGPRNEHSAARELPGIDQEKR